MIKIGIVNIDTSHPAAFAKLMQDNMEMQYDMIYNDSFRKDGEVNWFANKYCAGKRAMSIDELADKTDVGFIQSCNWEKHIEQALPFIKRGKPVFIDKPIVGSAADADLLEKLAADGAKFLGSSSARYAEEIVSFLEIPVEERAEVINIYGTCGVDEFNYGVHITEIISEIAQSEPVGGKFIGSCNKDGLTTETYEVEFKNGVMGIYTLNIGKWQPFCITVMTTKSSYTFKIDSGKIYKALLDRIQDYAVSGKDALADVKALADCTRLMLCGKKSKDEKNGAFVSVKELSSSDKYDGYAFAEGYGKISGIIYKG
jgi:hypothetical protein